MVNYANSVDQFSFRLFPKETFMKLREFKSPSVRRTFIERETKAKLSAIKNKKLETNANVHCENLIGATTVPLGVAGPVNVRGNLASGSYLLPIATTEGALVASISRGAKAINESGGAISSFQNQGMTRGPVFYTGSIRESEKLANWIGKNKLLIRKTAEGTSSHLIYKGAFIKRLADKVFVRFSFDTSEAMGMNMATIATQMIVNLIEEKTGYKCLSVAANFDIDKKPSYLNILLGRGYEVWSEIVLEEKVVKEVLKTDIKNLYDTWLSKCVYGSYLSGSLGGNAQFANVIAGIYIAAGQDPGHIVEGSHGITTMKILEDGKLYVSVYLPAIIIGLVGGGTKLPAQKEAIQIINLHSKNKKDEFAEVIGAGVLAGEISLLAAQSSHQLACAHEKLGRRKKA